MSTFISIITTSSTGVACLLIVLSLQLGLSQWCSSRAKFESGQYPSQSKRRLDIPIIWTICCLLFLNSTGVIYAAIWHGDNFYAGYNGLTFCDIFVRLQVFASIGVMCGVTATVRNLCMIISPKGPPLYFQTRWKKQLIDFAMCAAFPIIQNPLIYIVQSRRFMVVENMGCNVVVSNSWVSLIVYHIWFALWAAIAAGYAMLTCYYCYRRKKDFSDILSCTGSGLTAAQFMRLMTFSIIIICGQLPVSLYLVVMRCMNIATVKYSFKDVHSGWNTIGFVYYDGVQFIDRWLFIAFAYVAFLVFGLGRDARLAYMRILDALRVGWMVRALRDWLVSTTSTCRARMHSSKRAGPAPSSVAGGANGKDLRVTITQYTTHKGQSLSSAASGGKLLVHTTSVDSSIGSISPSEKIFFGDGDRPSLGRGLSGNGVNPVDGDMMHRSFMISKLSSPNSATSYTQYPHLNARDAILDNWSPTHENLDLERQGGNGWYVRGLEHDELEDDDHEDNVTGANKSGLIVQVESCSNRSSRHGLWSKWHNEIWGIVFVYK